MFTDEIMINPSGDQDYNNGILTHEMSHLEYSHLTNNQKKEWETSDLMKTPVTAYNKKILEEHGDKKITIGGFNTNLFRDEQFAELSRIIHSKQTKFLAPVIVDDSTLQKQTSFYNKFSDK